MAARTPLEAELGDNPWVAFENWFSKALKLKVNNPNFMVLTTSKDNKPNSRVVLLKQHSEQLGFVFFTNYQSAKSEELISNSFCSLLFFWDELSLQVRVKGQAQKTSAEVSKNYFDSRNYESRIGAIASLQSQTLQSREFFEKRIEKIVAEHENKPVVCPDNWGGWAVKPYYFEFWKAHPSRLHERLAFSWQEKQWQSFVLYP